MAMNYITKSAHEKLVSELEHLKGPKRREIQEALAIARSFGDLSENAEYDAAKHAMTLNETRIGELEQQLHSTQIVDDRDIPLGKAYLGATVKVLDLDYDEEELFHLVSGPEADAAAGKISVDSPVGKGLLGHEEGDEVSIEVPRGTLKFRILEISRK